MPTRFSRAFFAVAATVAASLATGLAVSGPAIAAPAAPAGNTATAQCLTLTDCYTLREFDGDSSPGLAMQASGAYGGAPIVVDPADSTNFLQDWLYVDLGTVSSYSDVGGVEQWGLTSYDFANYGTDHLFEVEFAPAGIPTGYCAGNASNVLVVRTCNGSVYQTYIRAASVLGYTAHIVGFFFYLSLAQQSNMAHHNAMTGSMTPGTQISFRTVGNYYIQQFEPVAG